MNIKSVSLELTVTHTTMLIDSRVRTLTGKEIELDIEPDYKVSLLPFAPSFISNITLCHPAEVFP